MAASVTVSEQSLVSPRFVAGLQMVAGLIVLAILSLPMLAAEPGPLTSDESLYVSEALNLAEGQGYTYATGEPVNHRGPVFPVLVAADFSIAGVSLGHARGVPRLFALGSAVLLLALGWRLFGRESGLLATALSLISSLLILMSTALFLDGTQSFFMLLTLLFLYGALIDGRPLWAGLAGAALGLAVLTKESALLWLPLPLLMVLLLGPAVDRPRALLAAYGIGFVLVAGWWWLYVYAVTGRVYLLGEPSVAAGWLGAVALCLALAAAVALAMAGRGARGSIRPRLRWPLVLVLVLAWGGLFLVGLERHSGWPYPRDYLTNVPDYLTTVLASWVRPLPLIAIAWAYVGYRAARGSLSDRLLLLGLLLFLPFALFVANRDLHVRDLLPLVYLSYLALARATIDFARRLAELLGGALTPAVGGAAAALVVVGGLLWFGVAETMRFVDYRADFDSRAVDQGNWDNPLVERAAAWIEQRVPAGTPIMSGRLYSSHLYFLTDGRYPWWQLPTVRVDIAGTPPSLERASTLFRWEDHSMPAGSGRPWLYLRRYPSKGYYVALSELDLLAGLREHKIGFLVLTGDDAGFSSLSLLPYFKEHPAFREVQAFVSNGSNQVHIFRVDAGRLGIIQPPARVSRATADALQQELGAEEAGQLLDGLSPEGYELTGSSGTSQLDAGARE